MARWLKDYLHFGSKRSPPQPPKPDYTESEILRAYRAQKNLDFEDPYEDKGNDKGSQARLEELQLTIVSPRHRLIKVEPSECIRKLRVGSEENVEAKIPGVTDYSNPFDMKNNHLDNEDVEDTGYMEPYEIQRPIEDHHDGGEKVPDKVMQIYDSPYNDKYRTIPHERCQPSEDERPADEYDQPWEWKKDDISRAFAVQFESSAWPCSSPHMRARLLQSTPRSPVNLRPSSPEMVSHLREHGSPPKELIDSTRVRKANFVELQRQTWFHGALSCTDAERRLHKSEPGSFLVRTEAESMFFLSVRGRGSILHVKVIGLPDGRYMLGDSGPSLPCVIDLVQHYIQSPLLFPGEGQVCLQHPVPAMIH
ncbi:SH2 domain-containing adapter protein D-like isoform X2 [Ranitomeya imitator]|uniref:SH2 domain-containing adapter protein D-like isoform X2 n=1 Tax=Ranitomeya imitator TaxID=111125 RepID=UPI0037E7F628